MRVSPRRIYKTRLSINEICAAHSTVPALKIAPKKAARSKRTAKYDWVCSCRQYTKMSVALENLKRIRATTRR